MREHSAPRAAADGGGVEHGEAGIGVAVLRGPRPAWRGAIHQQLGVGREWGRVAANAIPALDGREGLLLALQQRLQAGIRDDDPWRGITGNVGDLFRAQAPVDGHQDGAEPRCGAVEVDELEVVLRQHDDAVAGNDAGARQAHGQALDARQVGGMRDALGSDDEGDAVWMKARIALNDVEQREITQSHLDGLLHARSLFPFSTGG